MFSLFLIAGSYKTNYVITWHFAICMTCDYPACSSMFGKTNSQKSNNQFRASDSALAMM